MLYKNRNIQADNHITRFYEGVHKINQRRSLSNKIKSVKLKYPPANIYHTIVAFDIILS